MRAYRRAGVAEACLWLQDRHGVDVSFFLFLIWAGIGRGALERERFERALAFSREWSENVVARLRAARRWMKAAGHEPLAGVSRDSVRSLRDQIAERERGAEKLQLEALEHLVGGLPAARQEPAAARDAARANVRRYLSLLAVADEGEIESRLATILDGATGSPLDS